MTRSAQHTREHGRTGQQFAGRDLETGRGHATAIGAPAKPGGDRVLVSLAARGDGPGESRLTKTELAEFTEFVRTRRGVLLAAAYDLTGDLAIAEDLVQSALMATYRAWRRIENKSVATSYVRRTMTNLRISDWRRNRVRECPTDQVPEVPDVDDAMASADLRAAIGGALARLTRAQRTVLVLRYYQGLTDTEIAARLGLSVGTVKSTIWRALRRLRQDASVCCARRPWTDGQSAPPRLAS